MPRTLFAFLATIIVFYIAAWYLDKNKVSGMEASGKIFSDLYSWFASGFAFILILLEMEEFWISIGWVALAAILLILGFVHKKKILRFQGIVIFGLAIIKVFLYDTRQLETIYRTISFIVLGVILLLTSFGYAKHKDHP